MCDISAVLAGGPGYTKAPFHQPSSVIRGLRTVSPACARRDSNPQPLDP
jgi:hypothetical protein